MTRAGRKNHKLDRIDAPQVTVEYLMLRQMVQQIDAAEDQALFAISDEAVIVGKDMLHAAAETQGRIERLRKAAVREYELYTWGREVEFLC
jgi:hypothetical protein